MHTVAIRLLIKNDPRLNHAFSPEVRQAVGAYARRRRDEGARWRDIAQELGVSNTSARKWMLALSGGFQQVLIVDEPPPENSANEIVITSPSGFTLTGCCLEQAVAVMQRLR